MHGLKCIKCAVLCWTVILIFPSMQMASRTRCIFYDVAANSGCPLHQCCYDCGSVLCVTSVNFMQYLIQVYAPLVRGSNAFQSVLELFTATVFHISEGVAKCN